SGTDGITGYSFLSAVMRSVASLLWIAYPAALNDRSVAMSSPLTIVSWAGIVWVNYPPLALPRCSGGLLLLCSNLLVLTIIIFSELVEIMTSTRVLARPEPGFLKCYYCTN